VVSVPFGGTIITEWSCLVNRRAHPVRISGRCASARVIITAGTIGSVRYLSRHCPAETHPAPRLTWLCLIPGSARMSPAAFWPGCFDSVARRARHFTLLWPATRRDWLCAAGRLAACKMQPQSLQPVQQLSRRPVSH